MYREIKIATGRAGQVDAIAVAVFQGQSKLPKGYADVDRKLNGALSEAIARPEWTGSVGQVATIYPTKGANRLYVIGLGDGKRPLDAMRIAAAKLTGAAFGAQVSSIKVLAAPAFEAKDGVDFNADDAGRAIGEGMTIGNFEFVEFKGTATPANGSAKKMSLGVSVEPALRNGATRGVVVGDSANVARELAATPPNVANPGFLVKYCKSMATKLGLKCTIIDKKKAQQLKLNGLLAVGAAGSTPPALICLEHTPTRRGGAKNKVNAGKKRVPGDPPVMLVGKAITFDTGGYSLKGMPGMMGMKYDKCGGMAVIGAMKAAATLNLPVRVVGVIAAAENMVDQNAYRPNDILKMSNGVTVEVTNTDAEGRLVLADALAYGSRTYKPKAIIDLATLTGGVVTALGPYCAGAFVNDSDFREHLFDAAEASGERLWHLPLWDEHREQMKGIHSDIVNSAGRGAHPIQGAAFLSYFVAKDGNFKKNEQVPWAHLDIAGVADFDNDTPLYPKGPTGYGVRLLVKTLETWK